jgi:hypothetical protein
MFLDISVEAVCTGGQSSFHEAGRHESRNDWPGMHWEWVELRSEWVTSKCTA